MERTTESKNLAIHLSQVSVNAEEHPQCTEIREAQGEAATQTPTGNVHSDACPVVQCTARGWHWTGGAASGNVPVLSEGEYAIAVSPSALSSATGGGLPALLQAEQRVTSARVQSEEQGLLLGSLSGVASLEKRSLAHPSNAVSAAHGSTVSPRDFLSSPAGGATGLPLWSGDTPTAAAAGSDGRARATTFCRPLQSPSLCGIISVQHLGGIPLLPGCGSELASPSVEGSQQRSNGVSPQEDNVSKKFFFSAPFATPPDSSGAPAGGFFRGFAAASAAPSGNAAESPTGAQVAMVTGNSNAGAAGKAYAEDCQIHCLAPGVCATEAGARTSSIPSLQSRSLPANSTLHAATGVATTAVPGKPEVEGTAKGREGVTVKSVAATELRRVGMSTPTSVLSAATAAAFVSTASREGRTHRGVRPAAKSAILRCSKRGNTGAAAVVTVEGARCSTSKAGVQRRRRLTGVPGTPAVADLQQSLLSAQVQSTTCTPQGLVWAEDIGTCAAGLAQSSTVAEAASAKQTEIKAAVGLFSTIPASGVSFAVDPIVDGQGAAAAVEAGVRRREFAARRSAAESGSHRATADLDTDAAAAVFAKELYQQQDRENVSPSLGNTVASSVQKINYGRMNSRADGAACRAMHHLKRVTTKLYPRNSNRPYPAVRRLQLRATPLSAKPRSRVVEAAALASPRRLQTTRRLPPQGKVAFRLASAGIRTQGGACSRNNSINRRRRLLKEKKEHAQGRCPEELASRVSAPSCSGLRRRRTSAAPLAAEPLEKNRSGTAVVSAQICAAPLASALCGIEADVTADAGAASNCRSQEPTGSAAEHGDEGGSPLQLQLERSSSKRYSGRSGGAGVAAGYPVPRTSHREELPPHSQHVFPRRSGAATTNAHRVGTKGGMGAGSPSCGVGAGGSLSERVRMVVEKAMMSKHKIVWIERSEAKGFLPLPGMQEEKVYLVWTEKGIDVLVDLQAYIPWTHCPILMPPKHRRLQIPLLLLSSTSLSSLFSCVCRRTATSVFRLPLTRTPPAYRRSMLQMLRGEEPEQRQPRESEKEQHTARQYEQQKHQGGDECATRTREMGDRRRHADKVMTNGPDSENVQADSVSSGSFCTAGTHREEAVADRLSQAFSPCSTSAGSTGPFSLPSPPATDASAAAEIAVAVAEALPAESCVCAASVAQQKPPDESATQAIEGRRRQEHSPEAQVQQPRQLDRQDHQERCEADGDSFQVCSEASNGTGFGVARTSAVVVATAEETRNQHPSVADDDSAGRKNATANPTLGAGTKEGNLLVCEQTGSKQETSGGGDGEMKETDATAEKRTVPLTDNNDKGECAAVGDLHSKPNGSSDSVKVECGLKPHACTGDSHKGSLITTGTVLPPRFSQRNESPTGDSLESALEDSAAAEGNKKKTALDMRDFYCCSQGKVVGEDYIYFRQMLPDDEGADVYDISVSVKKRPKKTFFRKSRLAALWSMLSKRDQQRQREGILVGDAELTDAISNDLQGPTYTEKGSGAATLNDARSQPLTLTKAIIGDKPSINIPEASGATEITAGAAAVEGDGAAAASQFSREELLRVLAQPEETAETSAAWESATADADGIDNEGTKQAWRGSKWTYVEEYGDEGLDERLCVPIVFLSEMRVLLGLAASPTPHRCNMSLASHRVSGAVQRRVRMFLCDGENRGQEVEVYAKELPPAAARCLAHPFRTQETEHQAQPPGSESGAEEIAGAAASQRQKRGRLGEHIKKSKRAQSKRSAGKMSDEENGRGNLQCPAEERGKRVDPEGDVSLGESDGTDGREAPLDNLNDAEDGTLVEVEFPTEFVQYRESDRIRLYGRAFLRRSLQILADVSGICSGADLSAVNLAQYAPNLFWNVVRFSSRREDLDEVLKELCPDVSTLRRRRKRSDGGGENYGRARKIAREGGEGNDLQQAAVHSEEGTYVFSSTRFANANNVGRMCFVPRWPNGEDSNSSTASPPNACGTRSTKETTTGVDAGPLARQLQREERRQKELELRFHEMKIEFDERAKRMQARRDALKNAIFCESKWSKKSRLPAVPENDDRALICAVIDPEEGILKWPLSAMTVRQKNVIYQACLKRDLTACICLKRLPGKGRAVFAADRILKDDFVVGEATFDRVRSLCFFVAYPHAVNHRQSSVPFVENDRVLEYRPMTVICIEWKDALVRVHFASEEYKGELCSEREAREREQKYNRSKVPMGSFMFYFKNGSRMMAIDATDEKQDFGPARLINHSRRNPNMTPRAILLNESHGEPRLIFVARRNIEKGEELLVDYGERDPDVIREHPWLNN